MKRRNLVFKGIITFLIFASTWEISAQTKSELTQATKGFVENRGQVYDQNFKPNTAVKYLFTGSNGLNVQLKSSGFSYDTYSVDRGDITKKEMSNNISSLKERDFRKESFYHFHRIDVDLVGANQNAKIVAEESSSDFTNYYTPGTTPEKGVLGLYKYQKITYLEIYPGIDLEFIVHQEGDKSVEYNFIVKDNGDLSQIKLKYSGPEGYSINKDRINIKTSNGNMYEMIPASWIRETQIKQVVEYKIIEQKENEFTVGLFTNTPQKKGETLIIDPAPILEWATYIGGGADEWIVKMSISLTNDVYATGNSQSPTLATAGAYQTIIAGSYDVILVKFNESGVRQWSTYYGGSGWDGAFGVSVDIPIPGNDGVNIIGKTSSTSGIALLAHEPINPAVPGEYATFIARFNNTNGQLKWGTYYGHAPQSVPENNPPAITNSLDAIYITSTSVADSKIVAGATPIQATNNGNSDITIAKFGLNGAIIWGTYYGGSEPESGQGICLDLAENVYLTGITQNGSLATIGAHQTTHDSYALDAFLMKVNKNGVRQWFTYYGGTNYDCGTGVSFSLVGNLIYMCGDTDSESLIATPGSYLATKPGTTSNSNVFLACFNNSGVRKWGTYIGGADFNQAYAVTSNSCNGEALVSLETNSEGQSTPNAYQSTISGNSDGLIVRFDTLGNREWATYYGGLDRERCSDIKINSKNNIYVCGTTESDSLISTSDAFQPSFGGGIYDGFIAKFSEINIYGTKTICENSPLLLKAEFSTTDALATYSWSGPGGTTVLNDTLLIPNTPITANGLFTVTITSNGCTYIKSDSVKINPKPNINISSSPAICSGSILNLYSNDGSQYSWNGPNGYTSLAQNPIINPVTQADSGLYTVIVTNNFTCKDSASINVIVHDNPIATISSNSPLCAYDSIQLVAGGGVGYAWTGTNSYTSTTQNPIIHTNDQTLSGTYSVVVANQYGCTDSISTVVNVKANPKPILSSNSPVCVGDSLKLYSSAGQSYLWNGPMGWSNTNQNPIQAYALVALNGYYKQTITYTNGCTNDDSLLVVVHPNPVITVNSDTTICQYQGINVSATGASSYLWNNGMNTPNYLIYPTVDSTYQVYGVDGNGCRDTASFDVTVLPFIEVTIIQSPSDTLFTNQITTFTVIPSGYNNYSFYLNNTNVQNSASNTYTSASLKDQDEISVVVSDPNMCFSMPKIPIHVIGIYNSFSPNGDGYNDLFLKGYQITIFSRWGDKLFEGVDGWDGKYNGEDMNTGTYFFTLKYNSSNGNVIEHKGDVTVIR